MDEDGQQPAPASPPAEQAKPLEVTMMTFNVRMGCGLTDPFQLPEGGLGHLPQCAEVINAVAPDWVAVQEIDRGTKRAGHVDQTAELARLCGMKGTFVKKVDKPDGDYGLAVLSREEPLSVSKILVPGSSHTRCIEIVEFTNYIVACTHFPLKEFMRVRAAEIAALNLIGREKPVFLAGDFNATPLSPTLNELEKHFAVLSDPSRHTFRADAPTQCIDYIMVDKAHAGGVEVLSREVIAAPKATDHCAVVVKARINDKDGQTGGTEK
jgi:endonuclease/exonuclease/phosphatase family metal-dependent hydrolase